MSDSVRRQRWELLLGMARGPAVLDALPLDRPRDVRSGNGSDPGRQQALSLQQFAQAFPGADPACLGTEALAADPAGLASLMRDGRLSPTAALIERLLRGEGRDLATQAAARTVVGQIVEEILARLKKEVGDGASGRSSRSHVRRAGPHRRFAARQTIRHNLRHYDLARGRLVIDHPLFHSAFSDPRKRWRLILVVDQSGSMQEAAFNAAICAAVFARLPALDSRLLRFTDVVEDCTDRQGDPVSLLLGAPLTGGTHIARAIEEAQGLVEDPHRTLVVLVTDLEESWSARGRLVERARELISAGARLLVLTTLGDGAGTSFDQEMAHRLEQVGASISSMSPEELASWVVQQVER